MSIPYLNSVVWLTTVILGYELTYVNHVSFLTYTFVGLPSQLALRGWLGQVCWVLRVFLVAPLPLGRALSTSTTFITGHQDYLHKP